jgi:hypothetical protein
MIIVMPTTAGALVGIDRSGKESATCDSQN